jgi:hypothetical protein
VDDETFARSVASLCGALTAIAENDNRPSNKKLDPMQAGLAYADCWLDNILKGRLKRSENGTITFELDE